jgi:NADPH:quinone reductase-like Zn-dependent oxidoreductase
MKTAIVNQFGDPSKVIQYKETPSLNPASHEIVVKMVSASLNPADDALIEGMFKNFPGSPKPPFTPGLDGAGVVLKVGQAVTKFRVGEKVMFTKPALKPGALAEEVLVNEEHAAKLSDSIDLKTVGAIGLVGLTAFQALQNKAKLQAGQTILIYGASGGVGTMAIQMAKIMGAHVIAVGGTGNEDKLKDLGASQVLDRSNLNSSLVQKVDVFLDASAKSNYGFAKPFLKPDGKFVSLIPFVPQTYLNFWFRLTKQPTASAVFVKPSGQDLEQIESWLASGELKVEIDQIFDFDNLSKAFEYRKNRQGTGKILIQF